MIRWQPAHIKITTIYKEFTSKICSQSNLNTTGAIDHNTIPLKIEKQDKIQINHKIKRVHKTAHIYQTTIVQELPKEWAVECPSAFKKPIKIWTLRLAWNRKE